MSGIYLDYAAATPMEPKVSAAMQPYLSEKFQNPSAMYLSAQAVRRDIDEARHSIAKILGAKPAEIIFTSGATEANNLAISGVMAAWPKGKLITSAVEHESVLAPAKLRNAEIAPVDKHGAVKIAELNKMITDQTRLISVIMVSNELGTLEPIAKIAELVRLAKAGRLRRGVEAPLYLHTDAAQAANYFELNVARLGVELLTINGSKLYGPKQTGLLYVKAGTSLEPQITGGGQEFGLRSGTENVAGIMGFAKALEIAYSLQKTESERLHKLRREFIEALAKVIPAAAVNGHPKRTAPHIVNVQFPGIDAERLMMELDERGIQTAVGSACSAADEEPSHVLRAIGLSDGEARSCLRFSFGRQTTAEDLKKTIKILAGTISI